MASRSTSGSSCVVARPAATCATRSTQAVGWLSPPAATGRSKPPTAPGALMDDGELDVAVYRDMPVAVLAVHAAALATVGTSADPRIRRVTAHRVDLWADRPLPVSADSKVVGTTPVRVELLPGA